MPTPDTQAVLPSTAMPSRSAGVLSDLHRYAQLVEHRATVFRKAVESGDPNWALQRYRALGEAHSAMKREFKRSELDRRDA